MSENNPQSPPPPPPSPLSLSEAIRKIIDEPEYANFFRSEVLRARTAATLQERKEAASNIDAYFTLSAEELTRLKFGDAPCSPSDSKCTATRTNIRLLYAAMARAS
jgi:hypothetical protein